MAKQRKVTINTEITEDDLRVRELKAFIEQKLKDADDIKAFLQDFRESTEVPKARHTLDDYHITNVSTTAAWNDCSIFCKIYRRSFGAHRCPVHGQYASSCLASPKGLRQDGRATARMPMARYTSLSLTPCSNEMLMILLAETALSDFASSSYWHSHSAEALRRTPLDMIFFDRLSLRQNNAAARNLVLKGEHSIVTDCLGDQPHISGIADYVLGYCYAGNIGKS